MNSLETPRSLPKRSSFTYMKSRETSMSILARSWCSPYVKGKDATRSLLKRTLCYPYEGPRNLIEPLNTEFVLPI